MPLLLHSEGWWRSVLCLLCLGWWGQSFLQHLLHLAGVLQVATEGVVLVGLHGVVDEEEEACDCNEDRNLDPDRNEVPGGRRLLVSCGRRLSDQLAVLELDRPPSRSFDGPATCCTGN